MSAAAAALLISLVDSNTRIVTDYYDLYYENLPASFDGYRIVHLSDMHGRTFGKDNNILLSAVTEAEPHIIVITGDLLGPGNALETVLPQLEALTDIAPVYYVTGNHEWETDAVYALFRQMKELGVTALRNDYVRLSQGSEFIILAGAEDEGGSTDKTAVDRLMEEILRREGDTYTLLLAHRPRHFPRYAALGFDTVLSGHYHGGLVRLPFLGGVFSPSGDLFPEYADPVHSLGDSDMIVSKGLSGVRGIPRVFNPMQIPVIILHKK